MDWNNDGKHDWKDDAFYNNVIATDNKSSGSSYNGSSNHKKTNGNSHNSSSSDSSNGWTLFIVFWVVYILVKLLV